jgi:hypothetical protein
VNIVHRAALAAAIAFNARPHDTSEAAARQLQSFLKRSAILPSIIQMKKLKWYRPLLARSGRTAQIRMLSGDFYRHQELAERKAPPQQPQRLEQRGDRLDQLNGHAR